MSASKIEFIWEKYLNGSEDDPNLQIHSPKKNTIWKRHHDIRIKAKRMIIQLTLILQSILKDAQRNKEKRLFTHPEKELASIFADENKYAELVNALKQGYEMSLQSHSKLTSIEHYQTLEQAALQAGLRFDPNRGRYDLNYRRGLLKRVRHKERVDGKRYLTWVTQSIHLKRLAKEQRRKYTCPDCRLDQPQMPQYIMCSRCGYQGFVIGNLYEGGDPSEEITTKILKLLNEHNKLRKADVYRNLNNQYTNDFIDRPFKQLLNEKLILLEEKDNRLRITKKGQTELDKRCIETALTKWRTHFEAWKAVGKILEESAKQFTVFPFPHSLQMLNQENQRITNLINEYMKEIAS